VLTKNDIQKKLTSRAVQNTPRFAKWELAKVKNYCQKILDTDFDKNASSTNTVLHAEFYFYCWLLHSIQSAEIDSYEKLVNLLENFIKHLEQFERILSDNSDKKSIVIKSQQKELNIYTSHNQTRHKDVIHFRSDGDYTPLVDVCKAIKAKFAIDAHREELLKETQKREWEAKAPYRLAGACLVATTKYISMGTVLTVGALLGAALLAPVIAASAVATAVPIIGTMAVGIGTMIGVGTVAAGLAVGYVLIKA